MRTVNYREALHRANIARFGEPRTLDELGVYIMQVINYRSAPNRVLGLAFNLYYRDLRNTVSKTCPGWVGRVWLRMAEPIRGTSPIEWTETHTGTGGYGSYNGPWEDLSRAYYKAGRVGLGLPVDELPIYSWDYRIYREGWPEISRWWERQEIIRILRDDLSGEPLYSFIWEDPEQYDIDCKIMEKVYGTSDLSLR